MLEKHRSSIYENLAPIVGEEAAEALLAQFPTRDADQPITRAYLDQRFAEARLELHTEVGAVRTQLHTEVGALRTELTGSTASLRTEMQRLQNRTLVAMGGMLTVAVTVLGFLQR